MPGQSHGTLVENVGSYFDDESEIEIVVDLDAMISDPASTWCASVVETLREDFGIEDTPKELPFFTGGSLLKPALGDGPSVVIGPGESVMAHKTNEFYFVDHIPKSVEIYSALILDWTKSARAVA